MVSSTACDVVSALFSTVPSVELEGNHGRYQALCAGRYEMLAVARSGQVFNGSGEFFGFKSSLAASPTLPGLFRDLEVRMAVDVPPADISKGVFQCPNEDALYSFESLEVIDHRIRSSNPSDLLGQLRDAHGGIPAALGTVLGLKLVPHRYEGDLYVSDSDFFTPGYSGNARPGAAILSVLTSDRRFVRLCCSPQKNFRKKDLQNLVLAAVRPVFTALYDTRGGA